MKKDKIRSIIKEVLTENQAFRLHTNTTYLRDLVKINTFSPDLRKKLLNILDYVDRNNGIISIHQLRLIRKYLTPNLNVDPVRKVVNEIIRKVNNKYAVYPKKGGKRLGTHSTRAAAEKQLAAIHINKEVIEPADPSKVDRKELKMGIRVEMEHTDDPKEAQHIALQHLAEDPKYYSKLATLNLEGEHDPMNPGILKKRLGKLSCTKVRKERAKLKDKGTTYAKALQRYLNYHCQ